MQIIPRMLIQQGRCVSLDRGRLDHPTIWHVDPVETARQFAAAGVDRIHVTDLDAVAGTGSNEPLLREIIRKAEVPVQIGGGVRTLDGVHRWANAGAGQIVIGTAAVRTPHLVPVASRAHPDQIVLSVDIWKGKVVIGGWTEPTVFDPVDFVAGFKALPLAAVIVTDVDYEVDGVLTSLALTNRIAAATPTPLISAGLVHSLEDLSNLRYTYAVAGAMIGKALFDKSIDLATAVALAAASREPVAPFQ